jgi:hypothetical protein
MPEHKQQVTPVKASYTCDKCGLGEMRHNPPKVSVWPCEPGAPHKCTNPDCNQLQDLPTVYPHIRYE